jgi:NAD(P)-dependent dehydrogenase (short-subunit alcohol dehydrogenase family)
LLKKSVAQMAKLLVVQTDVTRLESVKNAVEQVRSELGQITALAYNASGYGRGGFLELDPKTIQQSFEVGVMGAVHLSQRVIPDMLSAGHGFISLTGATPHCGGVSHFEKLCTGRVQFAIDLACTFA